MALSLSEYKIRYPEFPKYLWDSTHPYSDAMNIKKDRRNPDHTKRPLNAFMLFAKIQREHITTNLSCNHSEISKALGRLWQELSAEEKEPFAVGAKTLVELHRLEYPDYKYRPRKKGVAKESPVKSTASVRKAAASRRPATAKCRPQPLYVRPPSPAPLKPEPDSPMSCCLSPEAAASPASALHSPVSTSLHSPVPQSPVSIGSSSGYESELSGLPCELHFSQEDPLHGWSPKPEPDIGADLEDIEVTALGEEAAGILNPLAMFPTLGLTSDDLDDLRFQI